jgi:hypothetical protein
MGIPAIIDYSSEGYLPPAIVDYNGNLKFASSGLTLTINVFGTRPMTTTVTGAPTGLNVDTSSGSVVISGTNVAAGQYTLVVTADNGFGADRKSFYLTITASSQPGGTQPATIPSGVIITIVKANPYYKWYDFFAPINGAPDWHAGYCSSDWPPDSEYDVWHWILNTPIYPYDPRWAFTVDLDYAQVGSTYTRCYYVDYFDPASGGYINPSFFTLTIKIVSPPTIPTEETPYIYPPGYFNPSEPAALTVEVADYYTLAEKVTTILSGGYSPSYPIPPYPNYPDSYPPGYVPGYGEAPEGGEKAPDEQHGCLEPPVHGTFTPCEKEWVIPTEHEEETCTNSCGNTFKVNPKGDVQDALL